MKSGNSPKKATISFAGFAAIALLAGCASTPVPSSQQYRAQVRPQPKPDSALVYFFNETHANIGLFSSILLGLPYSILEGDQDGQEIAVIGRSCVICDNKTYTWRYLPPGPHTFTAMFSNHHGNGISLSTVLEAGHTYYYQVIQHPAAWAPDITIRPVVQEVAVSAVQSYMYCRDRACD